MIKKFNQLIDDMPFIIKLILGIIMTGIITLCFFIIGVVQVNAASIDYNNTAQSIHKKSPTADWIVLQRNTDTSLNSTAVYDQVIVQFTGYQEGVAVGVVNFDITSATLATNTCRQLLSYITVTESHSYTGAVITSNGCAISGNRIRLSVKFETSVLGGTNGLLEMKLTKDFTLASNIKVYGSMTVEDVQNAKNTDIQEQTNVLTEIINSNTTNITNAINNSLNFCNNREVNINELGMYRDNAYYDINGNIITTGGAATTWKISDKVQVNGNKTYTYQKTSTTSITLFCYFNNEDTLIGCYNGSTSYTLNTTVDGYIRFNISKATATTGATFNGTYCQDRTEAEIDYYKQFIEQMAHQSEWDEEDDEVKNGLLRNIISGIGNIFGFLGDDELDDPDDALGDLSSNMGTNNVISSLLLLPVSIYQSVVNNINGTCNSFNLGSLYNHNLTMTCIRPQDYLGSVLWGVIDVIISIYCCI